MAKQGKNLAEDYNFTAAEINKSIGDRAKPHVYRDGEYIAVDADPQPYPKAKYHADYIHNPKAGENLKYTEVPQLVNNKEEEDLLGPEWLDRPQMETAPDTSAVAKMRLIEAQQGGSWRKAVNLSNDNITEKHLEFAQAQGVPGLTDMASLLKLLSTFSGSQMRDFQKEFAEWNKPVEEKKGPGRPPKVA